MTAKINLLPDLRQARLRSRRRKSLVTGIGIVVSLVSVVVVIILAIATAAQGLASKSAANAITNKQSQLEAQPGLVKALTAQHHLAALPPLYQSRVYLSNFFAVYQENSPSEVALTTLTLDANNMLQVTGAATSYNAVARLARALEAKKISDTPAFTNLTLQSASRDTTGTVTFSITTTVASGVAANSGSNQ